MGRWSIERRMATRLDHDDENPNGVRGRGLSPAEVQHARLALAEEVVSLVLHEGATLPPPLLEALQGLSQLLDEAVKQALLLR